MARRLAIPSAAFGIEPKRLLDPGEDLDSSPAGFDEVEHAVGLVLGEPDSARPRLLGRARP